MVEPGTNGMNSHVVMSYHVSYQFAFIEIRIAYVIYVYNLVKGNISLFGIDILSVYHHKLKVDEANGCLTFSTLEISIQSL